MNKIKLLYDVARTMRAKEKVDGILTAQVRKDKEEVFSLRNEFWKNSAGEATTKVSCELNLDGSRVKRESLTEFSTACDCRHGRGVLGKPVIIPVHCRNISFRKEPFTNKYY